MGWNHREKNSGLTKYRVFYPQQVSGVEPSIPRRVQTRLKYTFDWDIEERIYAS